MNIVDLFIIGLLGICALYGAYRGFLHSLFSLGAAMLSMLFSFIFTPALINKLSSNSNVVNLIKYYIDNSAKINNIDSSIIANDNMVSSVLDRLQLARPLDSIIKSVIKGNNFASAAELNEIISKTFISIAIKALAFIVCYFAIIVMFCIVINLLHSTLRFPKLKYGDILIGAALGIAKGIVFIFVLFTIMPVIQNALPFDELKDLFTHSEYYSHFVSNSLILKILQL